MSSRLPGFYKKTPFERRAVISEHTKLIDTALLEASALSLEKAEIMIENVIGTFALPIGVAVNFCINGTDLLIPMVVEEPSIVAAVSNMARLLRPYGGFQAQSNTSIMIGQIQLLDIDDVHSCLEQFTNIKTELLQKGQTIHPRLVERGGGLRDIYARHVRYDEPNNTPLDMIVIHFHLDCVDAMGANMVNTIAEELAPIIESKLSCRVGLKILSNYATERLSHAQCSIPLHALKTENTSGAEVAQGIVEAYQFAYADPWRATTHNKGIMNGIDAVAVATGNDWRAIEAGAHAWASRSGQYRSLSCWSIKDNMLHGSLSLPIQAGTVGGPIKTHPQVAANLQLLNNPRAQELASVMAAVGLAQNMGALRALTTEGIQKGHMRMHARNVALQAGAKTEEVATIASRMSAAHDFSLDFAKIALQDLRAQ
jgi:hydroxymethylglutaryl-CoA reductase